MIKKIALLVFTVVLVVSACGGNSREEQIEELSCRSNMRSLATGQAMYFGHYDRYARNLNELANSDIMQNAADIVCPTCDERYDLESDGQSYTISCPCGEHGSVVDGRVSWQNE